MWLKSPISDRQTDRQTGVGRLVLWLPALREIMEKLKVEDATSFIPDISAPSDTCKTCLFYSVNIVCMSSHVTGRTRFSSYAIIQQHDCWTPFSVKSDLDDEGLIQFEMFFTHVQIQNLFFSTDTYWHSEESEHVSLGNPVFHLKL